MKNIPGIISIGYSPASNFNFPATLKPTNLVSVDIADFTFLDIVPESGEANNQQRNSDAGNYFVTDVEFKLTNVNYNIISTLDSFKYPHVFYIKAVSGNYLLGLSQSIAPKFNYEHKIEKNATGFIGVIGKLTLTSLCGLLQIA